MSRAAVRLSRATTRILGIAAAMAASLVVLVVAEPSLLEAIDHARDAEVRGL